MTDSTRHPVSSQTAFPGILSGQKNLSSHIGDDGVWIDVIKQMDDIYAELVNQQVELEKKNSELENAQQFIHSVISSISDVLIVCDINNLIMQVNTALESMTGFLSKELVGKPLQSLFTPQQHSVISEFPDRIRSDIAIDFEMDLLSADQEYVPMAVICNPLFDHENRLSGYVITGRPLGELRKAYKELKQSHEALKETQQQLVQSEKMASLGRLVAGVAHELNNPISFLYANMHALQKYEDKLKTYLTAIHNNVSKTDQEQLRSELKIDFLLQDIEPLIEGSLEGAERVSEIVKNLRKFTTPQEQKKNTFDLVQVTERAISWVLSASNLDPDIQTHFPDQLELFNKEGNIHQILINLIQNAVDAMEDTPSPRLDIRIIPSKTQVKILIRDNGSGIADENLTRIFDPFFTTKPVGSGTGLGLYISYGLAVDQCCGELAACNHENGGALFTLTLPRELNDE